MRIRFIQKVIDILRGKKEIIKPQENFSSQDFIDIFESLIYCIPDSQAFRPQIKSPLDTIKELQNSTKSFARFGDGEIMIIDGEDIPFQKYIPELAEKSLQILKNNQDNLLVGINCHYFDYIYDPATSDFSKEFYIKRVPYLRRRLLELIDKNKTYYSADILLKRSINEVFCEIRRIWDQKEIVIISCENAIKDLKYNIFSNAKKIDYIFIPNKNCYEKTEEVYKEIKNYGHDKIYILQAGPAAGVWASELAAKGYRALDLGHLQKRYDCNMNVVNMAVSENVKKFYEVDE